VYWSSSTGDGARVALTVRQASENPTSNSGLWAPCRPAVWLARASHFSLTAPQTDHRRAHQRHSRAKLISAGPIQRRAHPHRSASHRRGTRRAPWPSLRPDSTVQVCNSKLTELPSHLSICLCQQEGVTWNTRSWNIGFISLLSRREGPQRAFPFWRRALSWRVLALSPPARQRR